MEIDDERRVMVAGREVFVSRLVEGGKGAGYVLKTGPNGTQQEDFFSEDGRSFFPLSGGILSSGQLQKSIPPATPGPGAALVLLLRQALAEWAKGAEGYSRQLYSPDPVAIRLNQKRVHAPGHANWGYMACRSCGDAFALAYNRIFGDKAAEAIYLARFEGILASEHRQGQSHQDAYELSI